jgi:single-strand DNA-binding protein
MPETFVSLVGNLTDDPELRFTPQGTQVASFRLAVTPRIRQGERWTDGDTSYFTVTCWRELAAHTVDSLGKGDRALVLGRLKTRTWESPDGERRSAVESRPRRSAPASSGPPPRPSRPAARPRPATAPARPVGPTRPPPSDPNQK